MFIRIKLFIFLIKLFIFYQPMKDESISIHTNKIQIIKNSNANFTLIKDSISYTLFFEINTQVIDFNVRKKGGACYYEGLFSFEDLKKAAKVFQCFDGLEDIYHTLEDKLLENNDLVEFFEADEKFFFKFCFPFHSKTIEAVLKLNKWSNIDLMKLIDDTSKYILRNAEEIKQLKEKIVNHDEIIRQHEDVFKCLLKLKLSEGIEGSKILKKEDIELIKKWIDEKNSEKINFKLLWRATEHGKSAKEFHSRCDEKGSTITIIKSTIGRIFGGYTTLDWLSPPTSMYDAYLGNDPDAFIFSIDNKTKLTCNYQERVICCNINYGPTFGDGFDIHVKDNLTCQSSSTIGYSYGKNEKITSYTHLTGNTASAQFTPEEVEVYSVAINI